MPPASKIPVVSPRTQVYFEKIMEEVDRAYALAGRARAKGLDPSPEIEIRKAVDVAARVEALVGPENVASRIRELETTMEREDVAFKITEEIVHGRFGEFSPEKAADLAVRVALALLTEGITAGPLEGIAYVKIKKNSDDSDYLAVYYAGPIRAAGGTESAVTVLIADYVRRQLNLNRFLPSPRHIERYVEEVQVYDRRVFNLQIPSNSDQIRFAAQNLPVEITGEPTSDVEVSGYRDVNGVETNRVRGGAMMVLNDGVVGRSAKLLRIVDKIGLAGWDWLKEVKKLGTTATVSTPSATSTQAKECPPTNRDVVGCSPKVAPDWKYVADVIGGRPVFGYPMRRGGFRLRYGRSRNTGFAAVGIHPATMYVLDEFIASGTHIRMERPGKGAIILPVTSLEGPTVLLKSGEVIRVEDINTAKRIASQTARILYNGDIIIGFGEFVENNHVLVPTGYCEEHWAAELSAKLTDATNWQPAMGIPLEVLQRYADNPFTSRPTLDEAITIACATGLGLHPYYLYYWSMLLPEELKTLHDVLAPVYATIAAEACQPESRPQLKLVAPRDIKPILERLGFPHTIRGVAHVVITGEHVYLLGRCLGLIPSSTESAKANSVAPFVPATLPQLQQVSDYAQFSIRDKGAFFIGARMGRPEKAKERTMKPPVHGLYPVGLAGGKSRNIVAAIKEPTEVEAAVTQCPTCKSFTPYGICPRCGAKTIPLRVCPSCGLTTQSEECPEHHIPTLPYRKQRLNLVEDWDVALKNLQRNPPRLVKGVVGMMSTSKIPERLEKPILRSVHNLSLFKDGTIRFDATNAPLTHFKPSEVRVSPEKLRSMGYTHDYLGNPLTGPDQILELKVQDVLVTVSLAEYLVRATQFIDDLLESLYKLPKFYNVATNDDLAGHLVIGISPHTSAGIVGRIVGFTSAKVGFAHPYWHAAKRRNCDSDEDSLILLMDGLLNFSRSFLPKTRGGTMDAPLVLSVVLNPAEVDDEVHNMDVGDRYPLDLYQAGDEYRDAKPIAKTLPMVVRRLGTEQQYEGFLFTHPTDQIDLGPPETIYKTLGSMAEKTERQLNLCKKIDAVDVADVARRVLEGHYLPDILGNLRKYCQQGFRCVDCNAAFRRPPLIGKCPKCGGRLLLKVSQGNVLKYVEIAKQLADEYGLSDYLQQRIELITKNIEALFAENGGKQVHLSDFL